MSLSENGDRYIINSSNYNFTIHGQMLLSTLDIIACCEGTVNIVFSVNKVYGMVVLCRFVIKLSAGNFDSILR